MKTTCMNISFSLSDGYLHSIIHCCFHLLIEWSVLNFCFMYELLFVLWTVFQSSSTQARFTISIRITLVKATREQSALIFQVCSMNSWWRLRWRLWLREWFIMIIIIIAMIIKRHYVLRLKSFIKITNICLISRLPLICHEYRTIRSFQ